MNKDDESQAGPGDCGRAVGELERRVRERTAELERASAALRESEERHRLIIEGALDYAIFTTDPEGLITSWSPGGEAVFGWAAEEVVGRSSDMTFTPEDRAARVPEQERAVAREKGSAPDVRWHLRRDGSRVFIDGVMRLLRDGGGSGFLKIGQDVTERRGAEEALRRAYEDLEERVRARTLELAEANVALRGEAHERSSAERSVKQLLRRLITVQEAERLRIARDIHDELGQQVSALRMSLNSLHAGRGADGLTEKTRRAQELAEELDRSIDFLTWELRPASLDHLGLSAALASLVSGWSERFHVQAEYRGSGVDDLRLPPESEINLYRVAQEALHNVYKHAGASRVGVFFERHGSRAVLIVEDDGLGFDGEAEEGAGAGMGLVSMRERAALVGGEFEVESSAGAGTTLYVRVPVGPDDTGAG